MLPAVINNIYNDNYDIGIHHNYRNVNNDISHDMDLREVMTCRGARGMFSNV